MREDLSAVGKRKPGPLLDLELMGPSGPADIAFIHPFVRDVGSGAYY